MAHAHDRHAHNHKNPKHRALAIALAITLTFLVVEVIGGLVTGSLALLADAGHMLTDVAALGLALFAGWLARRPATPERSFGFRRAEVLAALINGVTLVAVSFYIFWEAFQRIGDPPEIDSGPMLAVAVAGLVANAASAWVLSRGGGHQHDLNTRGAFLHVIGDLLGSVGAIVAAVIMLGTGWYLADPILSGGIGLLILWSSWRLLRESVEVLLESTPENIDPVEVRAAMTTVPGIRGVHDLHIWTVTSGLVALAAHVECDREREWNDLLVDLAALLRERFGIAHVTLQPEMGILPGPLAQCSIDTPGGEPPACLTSAPGTRGRLMRDPETHLAIDNSRIGGQTLSGTQGSPAQKIPSPRHPDRTVSRLCADRNCCRAAELRQLRGRSRYTSNQTRGTRFKSKEYGMPPLSDSRPRLGICP